MICITRGLPGLQRHSWVLILLFVSSLALNVHAQDGQPKRTLPELINLGLEKQPALAAERASLAAAESSFQGLNSLKFAGLFAKDIPIRKQQACLGVTIAAAGMDLAEWETRYAVVRNYYSVIYAREQLKVVIRMQDKLGDALNKAKEPRQSGRPPKSR